MKYMLLMNYGGADSPPMTEWSPEEVREHIAFQRRLGQELVETGEWVDGQGLAAPEFAKLVKSDGQAPPVVTDGPFPESKELLAGYWLVDVESQDRAVEIAAKASAAPGPGGAPIRQTIEVRQVLSAPASEDL